MYPPRHTIEVREDSGLDRDVCYVAVDSRDARWDGRFFLGVRTTGIYCRPSCPARTPLPHNCEYFRTSAAAVASGYRACKRCRPDALPGSREWDSGTDVISRAVRAIRDGYIDEHGVSGLAAKLGLSERHLHRLFIEKMGASPSELNQTRRSQTARLLIEQTSLSMADIAFSAGFGSIRQFNDAVLSEYGTTPSLLRRAAIATKPGTHQRNESTDHLSLSLRLKFRPPYDIDVLLGFLNMHLVAGREQLSVNTDTGETDGVIRALDTPHGLGSVTVPSILDGPMLTLRLNLPTLADLTNVLPALRRWLDLDADPATINESLSSSERMASIIHQHPGIRIPGTLNRNETAIFTVLGQQVSLAAARTFQSRFMARFSEPDATGLRVFPQLQDLQHIKATDFQSALGLTNTRASTLATLIAALANDVSLDDYEDRDLIKSNLLALKGIGPWTVEYIALRCLDDPDAFPSGDLVLKRALGISAVKDVERLAERWRPWRGYALMHLWNQELSREKKPV